MLVVATVLGLTGCDKWDHRLDKMETWKDKLCACETPGCVTNVERDFQAWWDDATRDETIQGGNVGGARLAFVSIPKEKQARYDQLRDAMRACAAKP